jgi:hypothetical protein
MSTLRVMPVIEQICHSIARVDIAHIRKYGGAGYAAFQRSRKSG